MITGYWLLVHIISYLPQSPDDLVIWNDNIVVTRMVCNVGIIEYVIQLQMI